jgi:phytoene synthase
VRDVDAHPDTRSDSRLAASYAYCRRLHRHHGRSYYLATRLLPAWKRPHVHALYGFTRHADEIVDRTDRLPVLERTRALRDWSDRFQAGRSGDAGDDPILPAVLHTIAAFEMDPDDFASFLKSMAMDLDVTRYQTYAELLAYMEGSAAVIGTMMLPILTSADPAADPTADPAASRGCARELGLAFQLTNFIRDIGEDLERDRIYLPREDMDRFGVGEADLVGAVARRRVTPPVRALVRFEIERARAHYAAAAPGVTLLAGASQRCIRAAYYLYGGILDEVARAEDDPFVRRAVVSRRHRLAIAVRSIRTPPGTPVAATMGADPIPDTPRKP